MIFNPETYDLVRLFVSGTDSEEHDHLVTEGFAEKSCQMSAEKLKTIRNRSRIKLLPVDSGILKEYYKDTFEHLFTNSLFNHGILCIGIYRFIDSDTIDLKNRFIIANPPPDMAVRNSDLAFHSLLKGFVCCRKLLNIKDAFKNILLMPVHAAGVRNDYSLMLRSFYSIHQCQLEETSFV
ncbi:hypothetical protein HELRODRAFT_170318 [Helobdella robusta]|uniref:Ca2+-activated K+ channel Slowpoke-like C-terminal domain-containing protein n=1 Tax=Helobdella robusta TaxID=6412 RepID=T1F2X1_HELRO|nr:hypothetical protein HELRODRAFT_170318 [Helobdella robusta]ESO07767.1 hypothetical protein HELRODRAFT_170318 [Helobdella robusta]